MLKQEEVRPCLTVPQNGFNQFCMNNGSHDNLYLKAVARCDNPQNYKQTLQFPSAR